MPAADTFETLFAWETISAKITVGTTRPDHNGLSGHPLVGIIDHLLSCPALGDHGLCGPMSDLAATFAARLESVGGTARWCEASAVPDLVVDAAGAFPNQPVIYTDAVATLLPDLLPSLEGRGVALVPARSIDDSLSSPVALSTGELAIAETGSVLTANRELMQRAPTMLSATHLIIVPEEKLVADLDAAGNWLRDNVAVAPYVTFITGPSRTADIQRTLTIGVQGPREVIVLFVRHPAAPA